VFTSRPASLPASIKVIEAFLDYLIQIISISGMEIKS
jgi:hypothetical protein